MIPSAFQRLPVTTERIHREIIKLILLLCVAVAAFFGTRAFAAAVRDATLEEAAAWYAAGERAVNAGNMQVAVDAFRRATLKDRANRSYGLALARTQARAG